MTNAVTNLTQIISNSPTVTSLVAADAAASDTAKRHAHIEQSQKFQHDLQKTVLAPEKSTQTGGHQEGQLNQSSLDQQRKQKSAARRARRKKRQALAAQNSSCASPGDPWAVIDICV